MASRSDGQYRAIRLAICALAGLALGMAAHGQTGPTIRVWRVGSPHTGDMPATTAPPALHRELARHGMSLTIEAFPARGFASTFLDAVTRNAAPDVLAFDNFGILDGISVRDEKFDGIRQEPTTRRDLVRVTGAFDALLGPQRGWTFLFSSSPNHGAARRFAEAATACSEAAAATDLHRDLMGLAPAVARTYLEAGTAAVQASDPDRLSTAAAAQEPLTVRVARPCHVWANTKLAFVSVNASYETQSSIGHIPVLLVFRRPSFEWLLLAAARDPVSNGPFTRQVPRLIARLDQDAQTLAFPHPATLLSPTDGQFPLPPRGQRFGTFTWRPSPSDDVVAEITEFAYKDDARLVLSHRPHPGTPNRVSAGALWTTRGPWNWRLWSINRSGDVAFSETRSFVH